MDDDAEDSRAGWLESGYTRKMARAYADRLRKAEDELFHTAQKSLDPAVTRAVARVEELKAIVVMLTKGASSG